jgi:type III secretion protein J
VDRGVTGSRAVGGARALRYLPLALLSLPGSWGCGREEILHGLEERQANQVLVALDEGGLRGEKRRDDGAEGRWLVEVADADAARAQRLLAERELPRPEAPGFAAVFGKGSVVPTPAEDRARLLQALSGELSRTIEAVDGVVEARVHVAVPPDEPLRGATPTPSRGSVLVRIRPGARDRVEAQAAGIQALVAGAVPGLEAARVAVLLSESPAAPRGEPDRRAMRPLLLGIAAGAAALALLLLAPGLRAWRIPWSRLRRPA